MNQDDKTELIDRYLAGKTTPAEDAAIEEWLTKTVSDENEWSIKTPEEKRHFVSGLYQDIRQTIAPQTRVVTMRRKISVVAAAIAFFIIAAGAWYLFQNRGAANQQEVVSAKSNEIVPGGNKAVLTLADGSQIILDSAGNGLLSQQGNSKIIKLDSGRIAYDLAGQLQQQVVYNTIQTPRGGQYQLILSDGTKVWLNAESSLRYPAVFVGNERKVELTGEGYFEVAHSEVNPFLVEVGEMEVKVLGTHFNINAYKDEGRIAATLLEGSIKIVKGLANKVLQPGQRALIKDGGADEIAVAYTNVENSVAWKNGYFQFENLTIQQIMRQLSRWYDVDVIYEGTPPAGHYIGKPSRNLNLSEILKIIEFSGIKISLNNKTITVKS